MRQMSTFQQRWPRWTTRRAEASYIPIVTRLLLTLCAIAALSGCTVPVVGLAGIGVDQQGRPVGYLAVCEDHIDGATIYYEDPGMGSADDPRVDAGSWIANPRVTSTSEWSLTEPPPGWTATLALGTLEPERSYTFFGWTNDNGSSTGSVTFTEAQLRGMTPGQVRYFSGYDEEAEKDTFTTGSATEFRASACAS